MQQGFTTIRGVVAQLLIVLVMAVAPSSAAPPEIHYTVPAAVQPGQTTDLRLVGNHLAGTTTLWTSFESESVLAEIEKNNTEASSVTYRIAVPEGATARIAGIRVATAGGASAARLVMIDDLTTASDNGMNKSPEQAQRIEPPIAIDGACEAQSFDYYRFSAVAGQRLTFEIFAHRLGTPLDAVLRLLDSSGKELAYSDDEGGIGADARFAYEFPSDGEYLLEVRDIRYHGSDRHRYRLRIADTPLATTTFPLGGQRGTSVRVTAVGPEAAPIPTWDVSVPNTEDVEQFVTPVRRADATGSGFVRMALGTANEIVEFEPNNQLDAASPISVPGCLNGRFEAEGDRDFYQFDAKQGTRIVFTGLTRSLGSPTDLFMRIYNPEGAKLAEAEDAGTEEGRIDFTAPADGSYCLMVEDLHRRGGPEHAYRVEARPFQPEFTLALEADTFQPPQAGVFVAKVTAARQGYDGPIDLRLEGVSESYRLSANQIPQGKNETVLRVQLPADLSTGEFRTFRIVGTAKIGEQDFRAVGKSRGALRGQLAGLAYPPPELDGALAFGVGPAFPEFFKLTADPSPATLPQLVGTNNFLVKVERLNKFDEQVNIAIEGLPAGFAAEAAPIKKGQGEVAIKLTGPAAAAEATIPFRVVGTATFQDQPGRSIVDHVLRVVPALDVAVTLPESLPAGTTGKAKIVLTRFGEASPAVRIAWETIPAGVSAPAELVVPEGQSELEFDLGVAADVQTGEVGGISAIASAEIAGRAIVVKSALVALQVAAAAAE